MSDLFKSSAGTWPNKLNTLREVVNWNKMSKQNERDFGDANYTRSSSS